MLPTSHDASKKNATAARITDAELLNSTCEESSLWGKCRPTVAPQPQKKQRKPAISRMAHFLSWRPSAEVSSMHFLCFVAALGLTGCVAAVGPGGGISANAPTVSLTAPPSGGTLSGAVTASDNVGVTAMQFLLDGNSAGAELTAAPRRIVVSGG